MPHANLPVIIFNYLNHRGELKERKVAVKGIEFLYNPGYGYQPGWFLRGYCFDKKADRSFALNRVDLPQIPENSGPSKHFALLIL